MYKPIAEDDNTSICALLNFYKKIYLIIGSIVLLIGMVLTPFLPYLIKNKDYPAEVNIYVLFIIYLSNSVVSYVFYAYRASILEAFQENNIISRIKLIMHIVQTLLQIWILVQLRNYYIYLLIFPLITAVMNLLYSKTVRKRYPQYIAEGNIPNSTKRNIIKKVKGLLKAIISHYANGNKSKMARILGITPQSISTWLARNSFDSIFISSFLGLIYTAMYANYLYVYTGLMLLTTVVRDAIIAGVGNSIELESTGKNYADMNRLDYIYMIISGWVSICMMCLYQPFMRIWVGEKLMFPSGVPFLITLYFYISEMGTIRAVYADAKGLWWENRFRTAAEAILNIILNYCLIKWMGIIGIIVASIISLFLFGYMGAAKVLFNHYFTEENRYEYFKNHFKYFIVTFMIGVITYCICVQFIGGSKWIVLIVRAIVCCIVPPILYFIIYHRTRKFGDAVSWFQQRNFFSSITARDRKERE